LNRFLQVWDKIRRILTGALYLTFIPATDVPDATSGCSTGTLRTRFPTPPRVDRCRRRPARAFAHAANAEHSTHVAYALPHFPTRAALFCATTIAAIPWDCCRCRTARAAYAFLRTRRAGPSLFATLSLAYHLHSVVLTQPGCWDGFLYMPRSFSRQFLARSHTIPHTLREDTETYF